MSGRKQDTHPQRHRALGREVVRGERTFHGFAAQIIPAAILLLLYGVGLAAQDVVVDRTSAPIVALEGTIKSRRVWGPRGFGETPKQDSRTTIYLLKLKKPKTAVELSLGRPPNRKPAREYS